MNMLWAAEAMIVMSWLPDVFGEQPEVREMEPIPFTGNLRNMEHIAAAGAAIQNILLGATAAGHPSYWSSGGTLRQKEARTLLDIPMDEIFLGCLFVFPKDALERGVPFSNRAPTLQEPPTLVCDTSNWLYIRVVGQR